MLGDKRMMWSSACKGIENSLGELYNTVQTNLCMSGGSKTDLKFAKVVCY